MEDHKIPIAIAFTPNYFVPACVCILSVLKYSGCEDRFHFICLLSEPLEHSSQKKLCKLVGSHSEVSFLEMKEQLDNVYIVEKYTIAASYRLLLPTLMPQYDKVLYLDCDMIIQNNVAKLFRETDLTDNYMAGVKEAPLPEQREYLLKIDCEPGTYINSGFLLMNLKKLREANMVDRFLKASENKNLEFPDQDVINMLCKGQLLGLAPIWNSIRTFLLSQYKSHFLLYYTETDWNQVQDHGNVHYTGPKPWNTFTVKFDVWWRYFLMLPHEIRNEYPINIKMFYLYKIYKTVIGKTFISFLQLINRKIRNSNPV